MNSMLILTWLPIAMVTGLGGRLLAHRRGHWFGLVCALFWIMIVQASADATTGLTWNTLTSLFCGTAVMMAVGRWSSSYHELHVMAQPLKSNPERMIDLQLKESVSWLPISEELSRFDDWLIDHRNRSDIWNEFDEYVRTAMRRLCHATHVRPYRSIDRATHLVPMRIPDVWDDVPALSSSQKILAKVMQNKSHYLKTYSTHSDVDVRDVDSRTQGPAWCFPVLKSGLCIGVIEVGSVDISEAQRDTVIVCVEKIIGLFWNAVHDCADGVHLSRTDPVSGLLTRAAFLQSAQRALTESSHHKEPVAMLIIALERLRQLSDSGHWESVDEIVRVASDVVRKKIRTDDCVGRFDESRIVVFLRRVDADLTTLVATQLVSRLKQVVGDSSQWGGQVEVRCGVVAAGSDQTDIRNLMSSALSTWRCARKNGDTLVSRDAAVAQEAEAMT